MPNIAFGGSSLDRLNIDTLASNFQNQEVPLKQKKFIKIKKSKLKRIKNENKENYRFFDIN